MASWASAAAQKRGGRPGFGVSASQSAVERTTPSLMHSETHFPHFRVPVLARNADSIHRAPFAALE